MHVLVVDDQPNMRAMIRFALDTIGIRAITEAKSGREALWQLNHTPVTLVLSDWLMEDGDGLELLQSMRQHPLFRRLPFIMVTGQTRREQVQRAIDAGVSNYVGKPFDALTLRRKIEAVVGRIE